MPPPDFENLPDSPLFIIGVGRSGTSVLMTLLNGHSRIAFMPETHFLRLYLGTGKIKEKLEGMGITKFRELLDEDEYFRRLNISSKTLLRPYLEGEKSFDLRNLYLDAMALYLKGQGKQCIGDKDPRYMDYLPAVKACCPNAKVIHIHRDPRDVILSKMKADWSAHRPFWLNAMISQIQIKKGRKTAKRLFGKNYYEFSYESLVAEPERSLGKLLAFLGLGFEPEMLDLESSARELVHPSEIQWKDNTFKPVLAANTEKWRSQLSPFQIRCVEIICKEWFSNLGYAYSGYRLGWAAELLLMPAWGALEGIARVFYEVRLNAQTKKVLTKKAGSTG